jgi:hypothetical protein
MAFKDHEKKKAYDRIWAAAKRAKNPEVHREASRKYRAANLELIRKKARESMRTRRAASKPPKALSGVLVCSPGTNRATCYRPLPRRAGLSRVVSADDWRERGA